jgi:hypothetical protein
MGRTNHAASEGVMKIRIILGKPVEPLPDDPTIDLDTLPTIDLVPPTWDTDLLPEWADPNFKARLV